MKFRSLAASLVLVAVSAASLSAAEPVAVRLYLEGAFCQGCASVLRSELEEAGLVELSRIPANSGRGYVIISAGLPDGRLDKAAKVVNEALTPHRKQAAPGLSLELFANLDEKSAPAAKKALGTIEGVDAAGSKVNTETGVLAVRLTGAKEVTVSQIVDALSKAGIEAQVKVAAKPAPAPKTEEKSSDS